MKKTNRKWNRSMQRKLLTLAVASCFASDLAQAAGVTDMKVLAGNVNPMVVNGNTTSITSNSASAFVTFGAFSIPANEIVKILQASGAIFAGQVVGVNPSIILGKLESAGRVVLINPNGITFGAGASVNTAGLVASTLKLSVEDFQNGRMRFTETAGAGNIVTERGSNIETAKGGFVYLVAPNIQNGGVIRSEGGQVILAAGKSVELVNPDSPDVRVLITAPDNQTVNVGEIIASKIGMYGGLIRQAGIVNANSAVRGENGKIVFKATKDVTLAAGSSTTANGPTGGTITIQSDTGKATVAGSVEANGTQGKGGVIAVTGQQGVAVETSGRITANGSEGGSVTLAAPAGAVTVAGTVSANATAGRAGDVALIAATSAALSSTGQLSARGGLGGGTLTVKGGSNVTLESGSRVDATGANGGKVTIQSDDGNVLAQGTIDASATDGYGGSVSIAARTDITLDDGSQIFVGGRVGGDAKIQSTEGTLLASGLIDGQGSDGPGGLVWLLAPRVGLIREALVNVSGMTGGGTVLVGGDFQGHNPEIQNAFRTYVGAGTSIITDAIQSGNGGKVIIWSDDLTRYYGNISARGGAQSGNGGFVEVSGKRLLDFAGIVATTAPNGVVGTLLLDPLNITIDSGGTANNLVGTPSDGDVNTYAFTEDPAATSNIRPATLDGLNATVTLQAKNNITFSAGAAGTVTLTTAGAGFIAQAGNNISFGAGSGIKTNGGVITLTANDTSTGSVPTGTGSIVGTATLTSSANTSTAANNPGGNITLAIGAGTGSISVGAIDTRGGTGANANGAAGGVGGNVSISTPNGAITTGTINTSGGAATGNNAHLGGDAGSVTIAVTAPSAARTISIGSITANGGAGNTPNNGTGGGGGRGGDIVLTTTANPGGAINVSGAISTTGGAGAIGGNAASDGGVGGLSGSVTVSSFGAGQNISLTGISTNGSTGGSSGGATGTGGTGGNANSITITSNGGTITLGGTLSSTGGAGGAANGGTAGSAGTAANISLSTGASSALDQVINAGLGRVTLNATAGGFTQPSNNIVASQLLLTGTGAFSLNQTTNDVATIAANVAGTVSYTDANALSIGPVASTNGIVTTGAGAQNISVTSAGVLTINNVVTSAGTGTVALTGSDISNASTITGPGGVTLTASNATTGLITNTATGSITNSAGSTAITLIADNMDLQAGSSIAGGTGVVSLQQKTPTVSIDVGTNTGGKLSLTNTELGTVTAAGTLAVGVAGSGNVDVTAPITIGASIGNFQLASGTGTITVNAVTGNAITFNGTNSLILRGDNVQINDNIAAGTRTVSIYSTGRNIDLGTETAGKLSITDTELDLVAAGNVVIGDATGGTINVSQAITPAGTSVLGLVANSTNGTISGAGSIAVSDLALASGGAITLNASNSVTNFAASVSGATNAIQFTNSSALNVATVVGGSGVTTSGGSITLNTGNTITVSQPITTGGATGTVTLNPTTGGVTATAASIIADKLQLSGAGTFTLTNASNNVNTIASNAAGSINYTDTNGFAIGTVTSSGIVTGGGSVQLTTSGGTITSTATNDINTSSTTAAGGNVTLAVSGAGNGVNLASNIVATGGNTTNTATFKGGDVLISTTDGAITTGTINTTGGTAAAGGAAPVTGGTGGNVSLLVTASTTPRLITAGNITAKGGVGSATATGAAGGVGGAGGTVIINTTGGTGGSISVAAVDTTGGAGGKGAAAAATDNGGKGGNAGTITLTAAGTAQTVVASASISAVGGLGGQAGGAGATSGNGGDGNTISITSNGATLNTLTALGGAAGAAGGGTAGTASTVGGGITVNAGTGALALNNDVTTSANVSLTGTGVTLAAGKTVNPTAGTILIDAGGGAADLTTGSLTTTNNTSSAVIIRNANSLKLGNVNASTAGAVLGLGAGSAITGAITQNATTVLNVDTVTVNQSGGAVTLGNNNTIANLGTVTRGGAFTLVDTTGGLTLTGALTTGTTGNAVSITTAGAAPLALGSNSITGNQVNLTGRGVTQTGGTVDAGAGTITIVGSDGTKGAINMAGTLTTSGAVAVTIQNATTVALPNVNATAGTLVVGVAQDVTGAVTQTATDVLNVSTVTASTANSIDLSTGAGANTIANLGAITRGGSLTVNDTTGGLNVTGAITGGTTSNAVSITTAGAAPLALGSNNITGNQVSLTGRGVTQTGGTVDAGAGTITIVGSDGTKGAINMAGTLTTTGAVAVTIQNATTVALPNVTATAGTLVIGVAQDVTGAVTQTATDVLNVSTVTASTANSIDLSTGAGANTIANLGAVTRGGALTVKDTGGGLNVTGAITGGTTTNAVSITTAGGALVINSGSNITSTGANAVTLIGVGVTNNATVTGEGGISVDASTGTLNNTAGTLTKGTVAGAPIALIADALSIAGGTINAGTGSLTLAPGTLTTNIEVCNANCVLPATTDYDFAGVASITAGSFIIGRSTHLGTISMQALNAGFSNFPLTLRTANTTANAINVLGAFQGGAGVSLTLDNVGVGGVANIAAGANITAPAGFSVTGNANLGANVTTTNTPITFGGNVVLADATSSTLSSGGGLITITGLTDGTAAGGTENLTLNSGSTGAMSFTGAFGSIAPLGTLTIANSNGTTFLGAVNAGTIAITATSAGQTVAFQGGANATSALTVAAGGYNVSFTGSDTIAGATTFNNTGTLTLGGGGTHAFTGGITATAPSSKTINGTVSAAGTGVIDLSGNAISVTGTSTIGGASSGQITLANTTLADGVTLNLGAGAATPISAASISGTAVGATSNLTFNTTGAVTVAGTVGTDIGTLTITNSGGATFQTLNAATIAISNTAATQTVAFQGNTTATTAMTVGAGTGAYNVSFTGGTNTIAGATSFNNTGSLTLGSGGTVAFTGGITATAPSSKTINGTVSAAGTGVINLGGNAISVTGTSTIGGASNGTITLANTTLADGVTLSLGTGAATPISAASISGTANGTTSNLTINTTGAVTVSGAVGTDIGTLTITNSGGATFQNTVDVATIAIAGTTAAQTVAFQNNTNATTGMTVAAGGYNVSMTGTSNTIAGATTFNNTGTLTLGDATTDSNTFTGGLTATQPSSVSVGGTLATTNTALTLGPVSLNSNATLDAGSGTLGTGAITGSTNNLTVQGSGSNTIASTTTIGALALNQAGGSITFTGGTASTSLTTAANNFNIAFNGGTNTVTNSTSFTNTGNLNLGNGGDAFTFAGGLNTTAVGGTVTTNATINTTNTALNLGAVTLGGTTVLSAGNGQIDVGTVTGGGQSLTANTTGATNFNGAISGVNALATNAGAGSTTVANTISATSVNFGDNVNLNGASVTTTGNQNYTTATLGTDVTLNSGTGSITTTGNITGATHNLTIQGSGTNSIASASGIGALALNQSGGSITFTGNLDTSTLTTSASNFNIALQGTTNTVTGGTLTTFANTGGTVTLGNGSDTTTFNGGVTAAVPSLVNIGGAVNTTVSGSAVTLGVTKLTSGTPSSISTVNGNINFNSTLNGTTAGAENLTLTAGTADVTFGGVVGGTARLGAVQIVSANNLNVNNSFIAASLVQSAGNGAGTTTIGGAVDTNTAIGVSLTTAGAITVNNTITTTTGASGGGVTFNNGGLLTINGNITSDGAVTQTGAGSVTVSGTRTISTTADNVNFLRAVTLSGGGQLNITTSGAGANAGDITFQSSLTGTTSDAENLNLTAGTSNILFSGAVGATRLGVVTINSANNVTESLGLTASSLTQVAGTGTTLLTGAVDTNTATGVNLKTAGAITVNNTITTTTGASGGGVAFSNGGTLTINGNITSDGAVTQVGGGNVTITAPRTITTTGDVVSFANNVTLNGGGAQVVSIDTTNGAQPGANITFSGTLNATSTAPGERLTLTAGAGNITFNNTVGNSKRLGDVLINSATDVNINNSFASASLIQIAGTGTTTTSTGNVNVDHSDAGDGVQFGQVLPAPVSTVNKVIIGTGGITATAPSGNGGGVLFNHSGLLTMGGNIISNGNVEETSTAGTGTVNITGTQAITTTSAGRHVHIDSPVTFLTPSALTIDTTNGGLLAAGGNVRFQETVNGTTTGGENLTINTGTGGDVLFKKAVGGVVRLGDVLISNAQNLDVVAGVKAKSFVQSAGTDTTTLDGIIDTAGSAVGVQINTVTINVNNTINTATSGVVTFKNTGLLTIEADISSDGAVSQSGGGSVTINGPRLITTTGDLVSFTNNVALNGSGDLTTINTTIGGGTLGGITFGGTLDATSAGANAERLTLIAGTAGDVLFTGAVGGTTAASATRLGDIIITSARSVTENGGIFARSLTQSGGSAAGTTLLAGVVDTNTATGVKLTTAGAITVNNTITTTTGASGGGVAFSNGGLLTINGNITSDGAVTQVGAGNVTITAPRTITTTGDVVSFANNVALNGGGAQVVSIDTTASANPQGANITFSGTVNATTAAPNAEKLTLNSGSNNDILFSGAVGATRLGDVIITNARNVNMNGTFAAASLLQSAGTGTTTTTGNVSTNNSETGNGVQINTNNIVIGTGGITTTNTGIVALNNTPGTLTVNGPIIADGDVTQIGTGITLLNADIHTNQTLVRFQQNVLLVGGNRIIDTTPAGHTGGTIQFDKAVNGNTFALTLSAATSGDITFNGAASNLSGLTVTSGNNLTITPTGSITTNAAGTGIDITIGGTLTNGGSGMNSSSTAVSLTANKMILGGTITAGSGPVKLNSFTPTNTINLGSTTDAAVNTLELSNAELNTITTSGALTIGSGTLVPNHTGTIVASSGNNVSFTNPSGQVVLQTSGGNISVDSIVSTSTGGLRLDTTVAAATAGAILDANGTGLLQVAGGNTLTLVAGNGIGTTAKPIRTNTLNLTVDNTTAGDVYVQNNGTVNFLTTLQNQGAGKLWIETLNGAINTGTVTASTTTGDMILTASDTSGGNNAQINVGSGGLKSTSGKIALHAADVVTINDVFSPTVGGIKTGAGGVEIISGTGAGLDNTKITLFASETTPDDFGGIYIGGPITTTGNTLLIAATTASPVINAGIVQGPGSGGFIANSSPLISSVNPTTGLPLTSTGAILTNVLTVVTLRGAGGSNNGGAAIDLQNPGNHSTAFNLYSCPIIGCPDTALPGPTRTTAPFPTAPMIVNTNPPNAAVPGKYADGAIFYIDSGGSTVAGVGTVNDFTFYTPGVITISTVQQARRLKLEASGTITVSLTAPVDNTVIVKNGVLTLVSGQDIVFNASAAGNTIGSPTASFDRNLNFIAAGAITINSAIYQGNDTTGPTPIVTTLNVLANQNVSMNNSLVNIGRLNPTYNPTLTTGDVTFQGNNQVSNLGGITVEGVNINILGNQASGANSSPVGELIKSGGIINLNSTFSSLTPPATHTGNISLIAGTAVNGGTDGAAIVNGAGGVNIGSTAVRINDLILTAGTSTVNGGGSHASDASILSAGQINIAMVGNAKLTGGTATTTGAAATEKASAIATVNGNSVVFDGLGAGNNVSIIAGTANANSGLSALDTDFAADASASMISSIAFPLNVGGNLTISGGSSTATATIAGQTVRAKAQGILQGNSLGITVGGNLSQDNTAASATADATPGGSTAVASSSSILAGTGGIKVLKIGGNWNMLGGLSAAGDAVSIGGAGAKSDTLVGTTDSSKDPFASISSTLEAQVTGNINLISGHEVGGASASAAVAMTAGGIIKLSTAALNITGNNSSGLIRVAFGIQERLDGTHPPITVNGDGHGITIFQDATLAPSIVLSGAPPTDLDKLQATLLAAIQSGSANRIAGFDSDVNNAKNKPIDPSKICK